MEDINWDMDWTRKVIEDAHRKGGADIRTQAQFDLRGALKQAEARDVRVNDQIFGLESAAEMYRDSWTRAERARTNAANRCARLARDRDMWRRISIAAMGYAALFFAAYVGAVLFFKR